MTMAKRTCDKCGNEIPDGASIINGRCAKCTPDQPDELGVNLPWHHSEEHGRDTAECALREQTDSPDQPTRPREEVLTRQQRLAAISERMTEVPGLPNGDINYLFGCIEEQHAECLRQRTELAELRAENDRLSSECAHAKASEQATINASRAEVERLKEELKVSEHWNRNKAKLITEHVHQLEALDKQLAAADALQNGICRWLLEGCDCESDPPDKTCNRCRIEPLVDAYDASKAAEPEACATCGGTKQVGHDWDHESSSWGFYTSCPDCTGTVNDPRKEGA